MAAGADPMNSTRFKSFRRIAPVSPKDVSCDPIAARSWNRSKSIGTAAAERCGVGDRVGMPSDAVSATGEVGVKRKSDSVYAFLACHLIAALAFFPWFFSWTGVVLLVVG